jgi:hypothetical protein
MAPPILHGCIVQYRDLRVAEDWCRANIQDGKWISATEGHFAINARFYIKFINKEDFMLFSLRFG